MCMAIMEVDRMAFETFSHSIYIWVAHYLAAACLITIVIWASTSYLFVIKWTKTVRDAFSFCVGIGLPALVLAIRPVAEDASYWEPIVWFFFSMLLMFELLWITYLGEALVQKIIILPRAHRQYAGKDHPKNNTRRISRGY